MGLADLAAGVSDEARPTPTSFGALISVPDGPVDNCKCEARVAAAVVGGGGDVTNEDARFATPVDGRVDFDVDRFHCTKGVGAGRFITKTEGRFGLDVGEFAGAGCDLVDGLVTGCDGDGAEVCARKGSRG